MTRTQDVDSWIQAKCWQGAILPPGGAPESVSRLLVGATSLAILLVNASRGSAERFSFGLSEVLGDALESRLRAGAELRLDQTALEAEVRGVLRDVGGEVAGEDADLGDEQPCCWVTVVTLDKENGLRVAWSSGDETCLVRSGRVAGRTKGHVLSLPSSRGPATRGFGAPYARIDTGMESAQLAGTVERGDRLFVVSHGLLGVDGIDVPDGLRESESTEEVLRAVLRRAREREGKVAPFGVAFGLEVF